MTTYHRTRHLLLTSYFSPLLPLLPFKTYWPITSTTMFNSKAHFLSCLSCPNPQFPPALLYRVPFTLRGSPHSPVLLPPLLVPAPSHSASPYLYSRHTGLLHLRQCLTQKPTFSLARLAQTPISRQHKIVNRKPVLSNIEGS